MKDARLWLAAAEDADVLCHGGHVDAVGGEVPQHLDQLVGEGVEVDVELAICDMLVSMFSPHLKQAPALSHCFAGDLLSTSFLV